MQILNIIQNNFTFKNLSIKIKLCLMWTYKKTGYADVCHSNNEFLKNTHIEYEFSILGSTYIFIVSSVIGGYIFQDLIVIG